MGAIPQGEEKGCPCEKTGCANKTWIYRYIGTIDKSEFRNITDTHCYVTGGEPVTAHGKVVFNAGKISVYDNSGRTLYDDEYIYYADDGFMQS